MQFSLTILSIMLLSNPAFSDGNSIEVTDKIKSNFDRAKIPGLAVQVINDRKVIYHLELGVRALGQQEPISPEDQWHLGSDTKAMTATLIAKAIDEGKLNWDTNISKLLNLKSSNAGELLDIQTLLVHESGLPDLSDFIKDKDFWGKLLNEKDLRRARLLAAERSFSLRNESKAREFNYANINYVVLGAVLEKVYDLPWEAIIAEKLFMPLSMESCGFGAAGSWDDDVPSQPWPHVSKSGKLVPLSPKLKPDNPPFLGPAGTVHCSLHDWGKFIFELIDGYNGKSEYLSKESFKKIFTAGVGKNPKTPYTFGGWGKAERDWAKGPAFHHAGSNTLNFALAWFAPNTGTAYLITANAGNKETEKAVNECMDVLVEEVLTSSR